MESDARYAWVGAGLLGLALVLAGGLYWLMGGADDTLMRRYLVYFQHQSLEGLQINSAVRMQGRRRRQGRRLRHHARRGAAGPGHPAYRRAHPGPARRHAPS
jgi:hypothetical protein